MAGIQFLHVLHWDAQRAQPHLRMNGVIDPSLRDELRERIAVEICPPALFVAVISLQVKLELRLRWGVVR